MVGIEDLKDVVVSGLDIGQALSDGVDIGDLTALMSLPAAITGISNVPGELADMDENERAELHQLVKSKFDIPDDELESFIEDAVVTGLDIGRLALKFKGLRSGE